MGGHTFERKASFATTSFKKGGWVYFRVWAYFREIMVYLEFSATCVYLEFSATSVYLEFSATVYT